MGLKKFIKGKTKKFAKSEANRLRKGAKFVDIIAPGSGAMSNKLADAYDTYASGGKKKKKVVKKKVAPKKTQRKIAKRKSYNSGYNLDF